MGGLRSLRSCESSAACICSLAKFSLGTFSVAESANRLYIVELIVRLHDRCYITENIEKILDSFV